MDNKIPRREIVVGLVATVALALVVGGCMARAASQDLDPQAYLPVVGRMSTNTPTTTSTPTRTPTATATAPGAAIIIDHTCTDLDRIPAYWIGEAKKLSIHYAHTSHGSQIVSGLQTMDDAVYDFFLLLAGANPPSALSCDAGALCVYDGNPPETYIEPDDYWSTSAGLNRTQAVADTGLFDYSMWSWCGQQSSNSEAAVQQYLDTLSNLETAYPGMRFVLMTGHTDGGSATLERNNSIVRQYAADNSMVPYDFADIESYDPDGNYHPDTDDSCEWCMKWCTVHPDDCTLLPASCAHSHPLNCMRKAYAFWWMMARLAGWEGPAS